MEIVKGDSESDMSNTPKRSINNYFIARITQKKGV